MNDLAPNPTPLGGKIPIARYRFTARMRERIRLPDYSGSLLRGQFGAALKRLSCMTQLPACKGCPLQSTCPYTRLFEAPPPEEHALQAFSAIPNAYVVEPPPPITSFAQHANAQYESGQELVFHMVLAGHALEQIALVIYAWQRALALGLTKERCTADLIEVQWLEAEGRAASVWKAENQRIVSHTPELEIGALPAGAQALDLQFVTPLRLQRQGKPLHVHELEPRTLLTALARRIALVLQFHAGQPQWGPQVPGVAAASEQLHGKRQLQWFDWVRYSSRQRQEMTLGGVLGVWTLEGPFSVLSTVWPWLYLGQWLHVGKNATFGLGGYRLTPEGAKRV